MNVRFQFFKNLIFLIVILSPVFVHTQEEEAPASVVAVLTLKVAAFEKNIASGQEVHIYVLNAPDVAAELRKGVGTSIGNAVLKSVQSGQKLPENPAQIMVIGETSDLDAVLGYTRSHHILSITGSKNLISKGVTIGIGIGNDGKPLIRLNLSSTIEEGLSWNPAIMKVAKTVK